MIKSCIKFLLAFLPVLIWLPGCREQESPVGESSIVSRNLMDSIKLFDSLTIRNRIGNPSVAKSFARKSLQMAKKANSPEAFAIALNAMGNACNPARRDSAFYYYSLAVNMADSNQLHDKLPGMMLNLAMLYIYAANYPVAAGMLDSIVAMAEKYRLPVVLADAHNALGMVRMAVFDSAGAKKSYETALEIGKANGLYRICGNAMANLALFSQDPAVVSRFLFQALGFYQHVQGLDEEKAQLYVNIANMQTNADSAIYYNNLSLEIARPGGLLNSIVPACNNLAYAWLDKNDTRKAEKYLDTAIAIASGNPDPDWLATLYDSYADVMIQKGETTKALLSQKKAYQYRSRADNFHSGAQVRLLTAILDVKGKNEQIRQSAAKIEEKDKENMMLKLLVVLLVMFAVALIFAILWIKQRSRLRRNREKLEAAGRIIEMEEAAKSRLGFELHDHVGYLVRSIIQVIQQFEFTRDEEKSELTQRVKELQTGIRRISHRLLPLNLENENFKDLFTDLLSDFQMFTGNQVNCFLPANLPGLSKVQSLHLIRIVQELLNNVATHLPGQNVSINLAVTDNTLVMVYKDDGPGFDPLKPTGDGIGIKSIIERVHLLEGMSKLVSTPGNGTVWEFEIPL